MTTPLLPTGPPRPTPATPPSEGEARRAAREALQDVIRRQVVRSLGTPPDLLRVQVRPVGTDRYRANVLVGKDVGSARVSDSFFLCTDDDGHIVRSSPEIKRLYWPAADPVHPTPP